LAFQSFDFQRTRGRLFRKCVMCTNWYLRFYCKV